MMMSALQAGGMPLLVDKVRRADENNPKGYFEFERVKQLPRGDIGWLKTARGKAVKVISALLSFLPKNYEYKIIFMERDLDEILASQARMLIRNGKQDDHPIPDEEMRRFYKEHLEKISESLAGKDGFPTLYVSYNNILRQPLQEFLKVAQFLDRDLDLEKMTDTVDRNLYREKH